MQPLENWAFMIKKPHFFPKIGFFSYHKSIFFNNDKIPSEIWAVHLEKYKETNKRTGTYIPYFRVDQFRQNVD